RLNRVHRRGHIVDTNGRCGDIDLWLAQSSPDSEPDEQNEHEWDNPPAPAHRPRNIADGKRVTCGDPVFIWRNRREVRRSQLLLRTMYAMLRTVKSSVAIVRVRPRFSPVKPFFRSTTTTSLEYSTIRPAALPLSPPSMSTRNARPSRMTRVSLSFARS